MPIVQDYLDFTLKWKKEYGDKTLVLMQVGSFFEVYGLKDNNGDIIGSNIKEFSTICDMIISKKGQKLHNKDVMMAGFGLAQIEKYSKKLQENGYTVIIYTQDNQAKNTTRSLSEIISPGTYFSSENTNLTNNIVCIWINKTNTKYTKDTIYIGVSCIDNYTGHSSIVQFNRKYYKDSSTFDDLERQISVYMPSELILISNLNNDMNTNIIEYIGMTHIKLHKIDMNSDTEHAKCAKNAEKQIYQQEILKRSFPTISDEILTDTFRDYEFAIQSFTFLLDFIYIHNPSLIRKLSYPCFENFSNKLILANHSLRQLNIIDDSRHTGKLRSLSEFLNNCQTNMGKREFYHMIHNPSTNIDELQQSYDFTEELIKTKLWEDTRINLSGIKDIDKFIRKILYRRVSPKEIISFYNDIKKIKSIWKTYKNNKYLLASYKTIGTICDKFLVFIEKYLDIEKASHIDDVTTDKLGTLYPNDACFINKNISNDIDNYLEQSLSSSVILENIRVYFCELLAKTEKSSRTSNTFVKIHETPKQPPVLLGTNRRMNNLKLELQKLKEKNNHIDVSYVSSKTNNTEIYKLIAGNIEFQTIGSNKKDLTIKSKEIDYICYNIQNAREKMIEHIIQCYDTILQDLMDNQNDIELLSSFVAWIDNIQNKCYIATKYSYSKPIIKSDTDKSFFNVKELRHPLIEHIQTREIYVTNDIEMGKTKDGLLLYGTNAVGKTSFIRSVGIAIVMAQCGLYVPCSEMIYKPYTKIFTRIIGNDNLFKGLSTFAVEMSELRTILLEADENSLVLGDELCSGTESESAHSIFMTGVEWLHNKKSTFLFATHFHELNYYEEIEKLDKLKMMHLEVRYDAKNDILIYDRKLKEGPGQSMYGLEVCKSLNLPTEFLNRAHSIRIKYNQREKNILHEEKSHFNSKKIRGQCEICNKEVGTEVHHLKHQVNANDNNYIGTHHKNHLANLVNICENCHNEIHKTGKQHKKIKTSEGYKITTIYE